MRAFSRLVAVGVNEIGNAVQVSYIPATSIFVNKCRKLIVKLSEIVFVLPLCFWSGFCLVGNTALCTQKPTCIIDVLIRIIVFRYAVGIMKQIATVKDSQNP